LYIARAYIEGGIHVGKAGNALGKGASIAYDGKELEFDRYEILVGDQRAVKWVEVKGYPTNLGAEPVEGGHEAKGDKLFIAQAHYKDGLHPGKTGPKFDGCMIGYGYDEEYIKGRYNVLVYA
jgi:hypothetical protein